METKAQPKIRSISSLPPARRVLTLWREGDHLVSQAWVDDETDGYVDVYPESETKFSITMATNGPS
jgi:hypothetical protein